ncbi:MAG: hypothetical protein P8H06_05290 [Luminiphilus sp.]|jgi:hypothetical protein|nr:hypothetical protein [Luminiphilus sp.]
MANMLTKLLEWFLTALPFFFGLAFLAPLSVQVMAQFGVITLGGVDVWTVSLIIFGVWGGIASWTGRWI